MWLMLQQAEPRDYVVATGVHHSVQDFVERAFTLVGLDWQQYVKRNDEKHVRPAEVDLLLGDPSKAKHELKWQPTVSFDRLVEMMVEHDLHESGHN